MKNRLKKYWIKRIKKLIELLEATSSNVEEEYFHSIRIEIKKIRALFGILQHNNTKFKKRGYGRPFKAIFKQTGGVRELHIEKTMLRKYLPHSESQYIDLLDKINRRYEQEFFSFNRKELIKKVERVRDQVLLEIDKMKTANVHSHLEKLERKISTQLNREITNTEAHDLRSKLKMLQYNQSQVQHFTQLGKGRRTASFLTLLGQWHDYEVAIEHLNKFVQQGKPSNTYLSEVSTILFNLTKEKAGLLKKANSRAKALYNQL